MQALKIVWQEGMLLRPQHFQGQDRYHEQQLALRIKGLLADAWGFHSLKIDEAFLPMGKLVISQASGLLPDGTLFQLDSDPTPLALDIPANQTDTDIYLTLPLQAAEPTGAEPPERDNAMARFATITQPFASATPALCPLSSTPNRRENAVDAGTALR